MQEKPTFSILHIYFYKTHTSVCLFYHLFYLNNHFFFFLLFLTGPTTLPNSPKYPWHSLSLYFPPSSCFLFLLLFLLLLTSLAPSSSSSHSHSHSSSFSFSIQVWLWLVILGLQFWVDYSTTWMVILGLSIDCCCCYFFFFNTLFFSPIQAPIHSLYLYWCVCVMGVFGFMYNFTPIDVGVF